MEQDLYKILGVSKNSSQDEIKSAFRRLAKQFHPDIYHGDKKEAEEKFKKIADKLSIKRQNFILLPLLTLTNKKIISFDQFLLISISFFLFYGLFFNSVLYSQACLECVEC